MAMSQDVKVALVLATFGLLVLFGLRYRSHDYEPAGSSQREDILPALGISASAPKKSAGDLVDISLEGSIPSTRFKAAPESVETTPPGTSNADDVYRYTVQAGDTFSSISRKFYGDFRKWQLIFDANRNAVGAPEKLQAGVVLLIPGVEKGEEEPWAASQDSSAITSSESIYVVQPGDTLSSIAEKTCGSTTYWKRIYEANRGTLEDPARLKIGQRLKIPK